MNLDRPEETLRLMQLCSPMLPTGAFAYSQGLEFAVSKGWVKDNDTTKMWIQGRLENSLTYLDVPLLSRLYKACRPMIIKAFFIGMIIYTHAVIPKSYGKKTNTWLMP